MEELSHIQKLGKDMKSGYKIEWTDEASTNLDLIIDYLTHYWSDKQIRNFYRKLEKRLSVILKNPYTFPQSDVKSNVRRCVLTEQTTIYYEIKSDSIVILSLFDTRKNPKSLKI